MLIVLALVLLTNQVYVLVVGGNLRNYARGYVDIERDIRLVILGDSHANRAWAANEDHRRYNFAHGSDNIADMQYKLRYALEKNHNTEQKAVVLSFEPHLISAYREKKNNNRLNAILNHPYLSPQFVTALPLIFDPGTEFDFKRFVLGVLRKGGLAKPGSRAFSKKIALARFKDQYPDSIGSKELLKNLQALISQAKANNYKIIALRYPVHPYFDSLVQNDAGSRRLTLKMDSLADANQLRILDFSKTIRDPDLFLDQDHLNERGSSVFVKTFQKSFSY